jgi:hypothetical protein
MSQNTRQYAIECSDFLRNAKTVDEVTVHFNEYQKYKLS